MMFCKRALLNFSCAVILCISAQAQTVPTGSGNAVNGIISPSSINNISKYVGSTTIGGISTSPNAILSTDSGGIPSITSILPSIVQNNISSLGTISTGIWNASIIPVLYGGTGLSSGVSGGILGYTASGILASSSVLGSGLPIIGGGSGSTPITGTKSGNTNNFGTVLGSLISGNCLKSDASGNLIDQGSPCGSGTVSSGTANQVAWYASNGNTLSGLPALSNRVLVTDSSSIPSMSNVLPLQVQSNISQVGLVGVGSWQADPIDVFHGGTNLSGGTSGGILSFTGSTTISSSGVLSANNPIVGGGAGVVPSSGSRSGNTTQFVTTTGAQTFGSCVSIDASGNHIATGSACGGSGGGVNPGTINQLGYYSSTGSIISGLSTSNNGILITDGSGVPSIGSTIPSAVQTNITSVGTIGSGSWAGTTIAVNHGGTGLTSGTSGGIPTFTASGTLTSSAALTANLPVFGGGAGSVVFSGSVSGNTTQVVTTTGAQTSGNCVSIDGNGNHVAAGGACSTASISSSSSNNLAVYTGINSIGGITTANNGTLITSSGGVPSISSTLPLIVQGNITSVGTISSGVWNGTSIPVANGGTGLSSGTSGGILSYTGSGTLSSSGVLTANLPVIGGGPGVVPSVGTVSGSTTKFVTTTGTLTSGNCAQWDASGNAVQAAGACGTGTIPSGTINNLAWFAANGNTLSSLATANNGTLITSAGGVPSISNTLPILVQGNITSTGTITSGTWNASIIPVTYGGTGLASGTSGGILAYTASGTLASSSVLTANLPVIGGGTGAAPTVGTVSGNTTKFVTGNGPYTSGHLLSADSSGNAVDSGIAAPGSSSGLVFVAGSDAGTANARTVTASGYSLQVGVPVYVVSTLTNTGSTTADINGTGPITIRRSAGGSIVTLASGILQNTAVYILVYNGSSYMAVGF